MRWKRCEGSTFSCTSKRKKSGFGGAMAHFIIATAHGKGVLLCHQYAEKFTGVYFAHYIREHLHEASVPVHMRNPHCQQCQSTWETLPAGW